LDAFPRSCRHLATPPLYQYQSYRAVATRGRWVICFFGFVFQSKLTFPASAVTSADLVSWCSDSPPTPRPYRYRWYWSETKARRWVLCLFLLRISHETNHLFLCCMMYLRPETTKAVEGLGHLLTASSFARLQSNMQKRWEKQWWVYFVLAHLLH
jgi:hypothetical protein